MTALVWKNGAGGLIEAASSRPLPQACWPLHATNALISTYRAHYAIEQDSGFRPGRADEDPAFLLSIAFASGDDVHAVDLGRHFADLDDAKAAAGRYELTGDVFAGQDRLRRREFNLTAQFEPQTALDDTSRPCLHIGGVQLYAYFHEGTGQLIIAVDHATADAAVVVVDENGRLPMRISVGGTTVYAS
jgi:hypothetical protein